MRESAIRSVRVTEVTPDHVPERQPAGGSLISPPPPVRKRFSIRSKLTLMFAAVGLLTLGGSSWIGFRFERQSLTDQIHERLDTAAHGLQRSLEGLVDQAHREVSLVASRTRLRKYLADRLDDPQSTPDFVAGTQRILNDALVSTPSFRSILITDPEGLVVTATNPSLIGQNMAQEPAFLLGRDKEHLGNPEATDGSYEAYLSAPARSNEGRFLGVIKIRTRLAGIQELLADGQGLGETGRVHVAYLEGDRLNYLVPSTSGAGDIEADQAEALLAAADGREHGRGITHHDGREVLSAWRPIHYNDRHRWGMAVTMDVGEAFAPIATLRNQQLQIGAVIAALGLALAFVLAGQFTRPVQHMAAAARRVSAGEFEARAPVLSGDELGELAETFNEMARDLGRSHSDLERRVSDRTRALAELNEALSKSNIELQQFAYVASHDLQTPLRAISGFAGLLQEDFGGKLDDTAEDYIQRIMQASERMHTLIADLLAFSRVETRSRPFVDVDLEEIFADTVSTLESSIEDSGGSVTRDELPTVLGDPSQWAMLMQNLIGNGLKYHGEEPPQVHVSAEKVDSGWRICVRDEGIGISPEHHDQVFEIFRRLHTAEAYPGTGIGLALCRRIVERNGGTIGVDSVEGEGSTFFVELPDAGSSGSTAPDLA